MTDSRPAMQQRVKANEQSTQQDGRLPRLSRSPHPYNNRGRGESFSLRLPGADSATSRTATGGDGQHDTSKTLRHLNRERAQSKRHSPENTSSDGEDDQVPQHKALPPPTPKLRKGLRLPSLKSKSNDVTPLLTPSALYEEEERLGHGYFANHSGAALSRDGIDRAKRRFHARRTAEILRRGCEVMLLAGIAFVVLNAKGVWTSAAYWSRDIAYASMIIGILILLYPIRLAIQSILQNGEYRTGAIHIPSVFDPAPLLYPPVIPLLCALSIAPGLPQAVPLNLLLGLCALPFELIPVAAFQGLNLFHWALVLLMSSSISMRVLDHSSELGLPFDASELSTLLFPLHQTLVQVLGSLTTTSLLPAELQLLSASLVNLLMLSTSPQARILNILLWTGGVSLLLFCSHVVNWNMALERLPMNDITKASKVLSRGGSTFLTTLSRSLSHTEVDDPGKVDGFEDHHLQDTGSSTTRSPATKLRRMNSTTTISSTRRIEVQKWSYALWTYLVTIITILGPIRLLVQQSLSNYETFGWALSYIFASISSFRDFVEFQHLQTWIPLPSNTRITTSQRISFSRLTLLAYWLTTLSLGLVTVLTLTPYLYTDTRRKIFHFTMVLLLLPTAYLDPCLLSFVLSLVLAIFLLLDFIRAAQLRPLSKPIAKFLVPYVDGRDLRGPVVVSHVFLLIGCAIPLWLSMAGVPRTGEGHLRGWEMRAEDRDVSMLAGVVCVGMGDAAASLVGRRYGRRKWPWAGGKSLEGSLAFAVAVVVGLAVGVAWLDAWKGDVGRTIQAWTIVAGKCAIAASGASFTEAVLTGCNDNVVVPIVLWLLVRGLRL